jgi:GntR family transcriptional repressor for pyruvate dehydrogenase complex
MEDITFRIIGNNDRLVDKVVSELQGLIVDGRLKPGYKLPPERELAERLGVSRTVLREAIQVLVTRGLITARHGFGTVVRSLSNENFVETFSLLLQMRNVSLDNIHHVRSILEVENARLAALQVTEEDIAKLKKVLLEMDNVKGDALAFADKDSEFHSTLALTTRNPLMVVLLDTIRDLIQEIRLSVSQYPALFATVMPDHYKILERVAARDVDGAIQAMQTHLDHARSIQEMYLANNEKL